MASLEHNESEIPVKRDTGAKVHTRRERKRKHSQQQQQQQQEEIKNNDNDDQEEEKQNTSHTSSSHKNRKKHKKTTTTRRKEWMLASEEEEEIRSVLSRDDALPIDDLQNIVFDYCSPVFEGSELLSDEHKKALLQWMTAPKLQLHKKQWRLVYKASKDGFGAANFHRCCDGKANTITVIKSERGNIFGGFTTIPWSSDVRKVKDMNAFLFSLVHQDENVAHVPLQLPQTNPPRQSKFYFAVEHSNNSGPVFGAYKGGWFCEFDIIIWRSDYQGGTRNSCARLCNVYQVPENCSDRYTFLAGSEYFEVTEMEVFMSQQ